MTVLFIFNNSSLLNHYFVKEQLIVRVLPYMFNKCNFIEFRSKYIYKPSLQSML